jgi:hypothetical protein
VDVGSVADSSELYAAFIFTVKVCRVNEFLCVWCQSQSMWCV